jgi:DNA polymerase-1
LNGKNGTHFSKRLLLCDGHALAFYSWFTSEPTRVLPGFFRLLTGAIGKYAPTHVLVAWDPAPPTFRHHMYAAYKANRPPVPEGLLEGCDAVREELASQGIQYLTVNGYEADDVLGTLSSSASRAGFQTTIITSDLDLLQLVSDSIEVEVFSQYWPTRMFNTEATRRRFGGLNPASIPDYKALVGDRSDNLPGVRGIGEQSTFALLARYQHLEGIYDDLENVCHLPLRGAKRIQRLLRDNHSEAFLMRFLTTIVSNVEYAVDYDLASLLYRSG